MSEQINEDTLISISETPSITEEIKELSYTLNTGVDAFASITTEKINGKVEVIILEASEPVHIQIAFESHPDIVLFNALQFIGNGYYAVRKFAVGHTPVDVFEQVGCKWCLNNSLRITIDGNYGVEVKITLRYC